MAGNQERIMRKPAILTKEEFMREIIDSVKATGFFVFDIDEAGEKGMDVPVCFGDVMTWVQYGDAIEQLWKRYLAGVEEYNKWEAGNALQSSTT